MIGSSTRSPMVMLLVLVLALLIPLDAWSQAGSRGSATRPTSPQVRPTSRPQSRPQVRPTPRPQTRPQVRPTSRPQTRPQVRPTSRPQTRPQVRPTPRPQTRPQVQSRPTTTRPQVRPSNRSSGSITTIPRTTSRQPRSSTRSSGVVTPTRSRSTVGSSTSIRARSSVRPTIRVPREVIPAALPGQKPLPALRDRNQDRATQELLGTVTLRDTRGRVSSALGTSRTLLRKPLRTKPLSMRPAGATRDLIRRIAKPSGPRKPLIGTTTRSRRVSLSPGPGSAPPAPPVLPGGGASTIPGGTTVYNWPSTPLPWYCLPGSSYYYSTYLGSWTHHGPVWHHPWAVGCWSPWYLHHPDPWCHGWGLPWSYSSSAHYIWWHHGRWSSRYGSSVWISTTWVGADDYSTSDATIQFADDEPIAEPGDLQGESLRRVACDGGWRSGAGIAADR